jgi:hypothetical protein
MFILKEFKGWNTANVKPRIYLVSLNKHIKQLLAISGPRFITETDHSSRALLNSRGPNYAHGSRRTINEDLEGIRNISRCMKV